MEHKKIGKVAGIEQRKSDHIKINLEENVRSELTNGLEHYHFIHEALPEIDLDSVNTGIELFGKQLSAPILISSMTGGTNEAKKINRHLAEAAQGFHVAMGVGSQRAALELPDLIETFSISRKVAPDILLFANLGAIQLNNDLGVNDCLRAVDMIQADGLILHLNPLQEAIQEKGDTNFAGLSRKIEIVCKKLPVPVIVKEVGWGISERTAKILYSCGVSAIDVAGAGGTSWSKVEMYRASDELTRQLAATFASWGIPTAESILNIKKATPSMTVFASGGIRDGLDIAKCIALGAKVGGIAGKFLGAAVEGTQAVIKILKLTQNQIRLTMFAIGVSKIKDLSLHGIKES